MFFKNTAVKVVLCILCVVSLTVAAVSGVLVATMLYHGVYDSGGDLFDSALPRLINEDVDSIINGYFDPYDPTHPWASYYSGGVYTGENSNFRYEIFQEGQDEPVLSTVREKERDQLNYQISQSHSWTMTDAVREDVEEYMPYRVFACGGEIYGYNAETNSFTPQDPSVLSLVEESAELSEDIKEYGFIFNSNSEHYTYDEETDSFVSTATVETAAVSDVTYTIDVYLLKSLPQSDIYRTLFYACRDIQSLRYVLIGVLAGALILGAALLIILGLNLGRVKGKDEAVLSPIFHVPADVAVVLAICALALLMDYGQSFHAARVLYAMIAYDLLLILAAVTVAVYLICILSVRGKTHTLVSGSLIYWCVHNLGRLLKAMGRGIGKAARYVPLVWKVLVCYLALCLIELICIVAFWYGDGIFLFLWLLEKLALGILVAYVTLAFRRLKMGAEAIAAGDYTTKIDEKHLLLDFKDTADTLNHIQGGMNAAVDSRLRSERLKTELITNVSHDLKTPLTSIVSYVDLLKQEPAGSEAAAEYLEVLDRQSARLKKLVEDLVEASKASTGNISVQSSPLDFQMLLSQAMGEYNERLLGAGLTPVVNLPENPVMISADGRHLWRILDNLLGNTVKYAMPGTRFYVTLTADTHAIATFRNISREELNVDPEELMERFVRGDSSRHTEGSGLGLSIAKSLTESMGGEFQLAVDGDLFKAAVEFPLLEEEIPPESDA